MILIPFSLIDKTVIDGLASIEWRQPAKSAATEETLARRRSKTDTFVQTLKDCYNQPSIQISYKLGKCRQKRWSNSREQVWYNNFQSQEEKAPEDGEDLEICSTSRSSLEAIEQLPSSMDQVHFAYIIFFVLFQLTSKPRLSHHSFVFTVGSEFYLSTNLYASLWCGLCNQVASNPLDQTWQMAPW